MLVQLKPQLYKQVSYYNKANLKMEEGTITLKSYTTDIVKIDKNNKLEWICNKTALTYTTLRHIKDFLYQYLNITNLTKKEIIELMDADKIHDYTILK